MPPPHRHVPPVQNNQTGTGFGSQGRLVRLTPLGRLPASCISARGVIWAHIQILLCAFWCQFHIPSSHLNLTSHNIHRWGEWLIDPISLETSGISQKNNGDLFSKGKRFWDYNNSKVLKVPGVTQQKNHMFLCFFLVRSNGIPPPPPPSSNESNFLVLAAIKKNENVSFVLQA